MNHDYRNASDMCFLKRIIPGMRILKTVLAVWICLMLFYGMGYYRPIYAVIACVLMMKETSLQTKKFGINRVVGTMFGGLTAAIGLVIMNNYSMQMESLLFPIVISCAVMVDLVICKLFRMDTYVGSISCVVTIITLLNHNISQSDAFIYVLVRVSETSIGIIVAYAVNRLIRSSKP